MNRTKFFNVLTVNGIKEVDFLNHNLTSFERTHSPRFYRVSQHDLMQPDIISKLMYGTERFWWIICLVNGILSPLTDLTEGTILEIPSQFDIYDFYQNSSIRR